MGTPGRTGPHPGASVLVLLLLLLTSGTGVAGCGASRVDGAGVAPGTQDAAAAFLATYVEPDGRVVRRDQGGDTVSEGQAYAMLVAVAAGDDATFRRVWAWTRDHLARPDGTLSWRWADGAVADASSASDADLDAARALVLAGQRLGDLDLLADGLRLGGRRCSTWRPSRRPPAGC